MKWIVTIGIVCTIAVQNIFLGMQGNEGLPVIDSDNITTEEDCSCPEISVNWESKEHGDKGQWLRDTPALPKNWLYDGVIYETHPYYYQGHSFKEITKQIPELKGLGVKTIYLMPIWKHRGEHPLAIYCIYDYYEIDPRFGTPEDLKELINTAHKHNIRVILDLVTGYAIPGSVVYNNNWTIRIKLRELQEKAQELGWELKYGTYEGQPVVYYGCKWTKPRKCEVFGRIVGDEVILHHYPRVDWGPAVDRTNPELIEYLTEVAVYYVKEYDVDGFRLDAPQNNWNPKIVPGDHSILQLLESIEEAIKRIKPSAILISESPYLEVPESEGIPDPLLDKTCAASYSYYFWINLIYGGIKTSGDLIRVLASEKIWYDRARIRFLETHDTERINKIAPQLKKPYTVLISTIPGIPMIQAGQEIGAKNPYSEDPEVDWIEGDHEFNEFIKRLLQIRNGNNALKYGSIENVWKGGDNAYAYMREYGNEKVFVVLNLQAKENSVVLDLPVENGSTLYDLLNKERFVVNDSTNFKVDLPAYGARLFTLEDVSPPLLSIEKPRKGYFHIFDRAWLPIGITIILGKITIIANVIDEGGIEKVEFYVDGDLKFTDHEAPYEWLWDERVIGKHEVKVIAHDIFGNRGEDKINVTIFKIFNLGGK